MGELHVAPRVGPAASRARPPGAWCGRPSGRPFARKERGFGEGDVRVDADELWQRAQLFERGPSAIRSGQKATSASIPAAADAARPSRWCREDGRTEDDQRAVLNVRRELIQDAFEDSQPEGFMNSSIGVPMTRITVWCAAQHRGIG